jgi:MFS family permease
VRAAGSSPRPAAVLFLLLATGWAANHFAALIPVLHDDKGYSSALLAAVFGLYAVGLLPGLILGGTVSDRLGRARLALPGAIIAALGSFMLLVWDSPVGLSVGRLVVGLGAGATFSAGTAWMADLGGATGATLAGVALTTGFGGGPVVSGALAAVAPGPLVTPYVVSIVLSVAAVAWCVADARVAAPTGRETPSATKPAPPSVGTVRNVRTVLTWALPIAPFVFTSGAVGVVSVPARLPSGDRGPLLTGLAAGLVLGTGLLAQFLARQRGRPYGVLGLVSAAVGLAALAAVGEDGAVTGLVIIAVLLGAAYGLCLHAGLSDIERWSPAAVRGGVTGTFYVATYLGFGVPLLLEWLEPSWGPHAPLAVLAALALVVAVLRQLRRP